MAEDDEKTGPPTPRAIPIQRSRGVLPPRRDTPPTRPSPARNREQGPMPPKPDAGSPTITNVVDGGGGNPADIGVHVTVGDYLFVDEEVDRVMPALNAGIASFNNGAHTITMDANFAVTRTHMRLGPFVRLALPNAP
jgi:hypothetical protein